MRKSEIIFKPATKAYLLEFYGDRFTKSFKGHAALLEGKVVGLGGLIFDERQITLFSVITKEMRPFKKTIVKAVHILGRIVDKLKYPVVAVADKDEALSEKLLIKIGFVFTGYFTPDGNKIFRREP